MAETETQTRAALPQVMPAGGQVVAVVPQSVEEIFRVAKGVVQSGLAPYALTGKTDTPDKMQKATSAVAIVIMAGAELGLPPMVALRSFTAINGRPALYGDGLINVVRRSGKAKVLKIGYTHGHDYRLFIRAGVLPEPYGTTPEAIAADEERIRALFEAMPIDERTGGYCESTRSDTGEEKTGIFSVAQAKRAGLWQTETEVMKRVWEDKPDGSRGGFVNKKVPNDSPWFRYPERMLGWRAAGFCLRELYGDALGGITDDWEAREIGGMIEVNARREEPPTPPPAPKAPTDTTSSEASTEVEEIIAEADARMGADQSSDLPKMVQPEDDMNGDDSQVSTEQEETTLEKLEFWCAGAKTVDEITEAWKDLGVEGEYAEGTPDRIAAEQIRTKHLDRLETIRQGNAVGDLLAADASPPPAPKK